MNALSQLAKRRIVIIGAGPAGLAVGRLLYLRGISARLLERDVSRHARTQGGSLDLTDGKGLRAIEELRLTREFADKSRPGGQRYVVLDEHARVHADLTEEDLGASRPEIDRAELRGMLLDSLPESAIEWGTTVAGISAAGNGYVLTATDGTTIEADLVIACDGIGSAARHLVTTARPTYSGITFIQGTITCPRESSFISRTLGDGSMFALGDGRAIMGQRQGDGSIRIYFALHLPDDPQRRYGAAIRDEAALRDDLLDAFAGWNPRLLAIVDDIDDGYSRWPLYGLPADQRWNHRSGLTLVGDAAHVMPPFTGQGVNMALLDAVELVDALTSNDFDSIDDAIESYESAMLTRMGAAIDDTAAAQRRIMATDAPLPLLAALGIAPTR